MKRETVDGLVRFITSVTSLLLSAWFLMLTMGMYAEHFGWPLFSYWQALVAVFVLGSIVGYGTSSIYWYTTQKDRR